jgi:D-methionine transport system ATP-binding protein
MQIKLESLVKSYLNNDTRVYAVKDVTLNIPQNKIFGIIGKSGAGKSSLVRLISLLEPPDSGAVYYDGQRVDNLNQKELILKRRRTGMIFQNFNLFSSRTAGQNIAYPMEICKIPKDKIKVRVKELLELVGLSDRSKSPISTLSGGQKQRIAIARALANEPDVLFCDEATSALDPQTTHSILELIREIQKKMNLTVVMITHQMEVVRDACDEVAVLEEGRVVEQGKVSEVFANPKADTTRDFLRHLNKEFTNELE